MNQPPIFLSEDKRVPMAREVNNFVRQICSATGDPMSLWSGDFNAFIEEQSMRVLLAEIMVSMTEEFLPPEDRYTTNHNGNSQSLDYIMVNKAMMSREPEVRVLHINSDFMGRIADHDPVVARFRF